MKPIAVITGASRGIGAAVLKRLRGTGYQCVAIGRSDPQMKDVEFIRADLAELRETRRAADLLRQVASERTVSVLVNNAGGAAPSPVAHATDTQLLRDLTLNLTSPILLAYAVLPAMCDRGQGVIVNVTSTAGRTGVAYLAGYSAAKAGLIGFTQSIAAECAPHGVRVHGVGPGAVATEMATYGRAQLSRLHGLNPESYENAMATGTGLGRLIQPNEVAEIVEWLVVHANSAISGQTLNACGTLTMG